jgi:drug/metabolite transporter (DMT)-like permease
VNPGTDGWFWLSLIGFIAYLQQVYVAKAISKVPLMVLIPINFVSLIFATLMSYVVYDKLIDQWTFAGALLILAGTLYNANRNRSIAARETQTAQVV